jgi:hypothetical protein
MIRAAKGTVIREMTLREYEDEIRVLCAALYAHVDLFTH